ncbi:MAG TPA: tetratricopeptide repeat protein [Gemmatimonadales bacterium]|nr:tetratricopeptide repeat protein [Gemmatimonadales bacterium]
MAYTSEIEKLEKRWAENPKGRNFAPLADAYRKAGELDRAIELCKAGLARHPDYVSAHIVYGRCLIDQHNDAGASEVFRKVLTLDPENVLGLKILAEIAERGGRYEETVEWLGRLLNADPMNGEAGEALIRAKSKAAQAATVKTAAPLVPATPAPAAPPPAPAPPPPAAARATAARAPAPAPSAGPAARSGVAAPAPAGARPTPRPSAAPPAPPAPPGPPRPPPPPPARAPATGASVARLVPEATPPQRPAPDFVVQSEEPPPPPQLSVTGQPRDIETFDGTLDFNAVAHDAARADGLEVQEEVRLKPQELHVEGLARTQYESGAYTPPPEAAGAEETFPKIDLPLIMPDEVPARAPAGSAGVGGVGGPADTAPPAAVRLSDDDGAADTAALSRVEPVLTETMAELYLRQGHLDEALRVYQALLAERPGDARLRARVAALSPGGRPGRHGTGESLTGFLKRLMAARPGAAAEPPAPTPSLPPAPYPHGPPRAAAPQERESATTHGGSPLLENAFGTGSAAERGSVPGALGEATRPAAAGDNISLDQVFGEEGLGSSSARAEPHEPSHPAEPHAALPPPPSPPAAAEPSQQTGGFSFDQFFSPAAPPATGGAPGAPGGAGGGGGAGGPAAPKAPGRTSGSKPRPQAEDEGDLDQFQAWLRGLKS